MSIHKLGPCFVCGHQTANFCSRCEAIFYCSTQHLTEDWSRHRLSCIAIGTVPVTQPVPQTGYTQYQVDAGGRSSFQAHTSHQVPSSYKLRPSQQMSPPSHREPPTLPFEAIYLGEHDDNPRIVRVECRPRAPAALPTLIHSPYVASPATYFEVNHGVVGELRFPLQVWYCTSNSGSENRAIQRLTNGLAPRSWKGGVIVMKCGSTLRNSYTSATVLDLPTLKHFFMNRA